MGLLVPVAVSVWVFGTWSAAEVGAGAVKEVEQWIGVVVAFEEVSEFASEAGVCAAFDAEPVNIA